MIIQTVTALFVGVLSSGNASASQDPAGRWVLCIYEQVQAVAAAETPETAAVAIRDRCADIYRDLEALSDNAAFQQTIEIANRPESIAELIRSERATAADAAALAVRQREAQQEMQSSLVGDWRTTNATCENIITLSANGDVALNGRLHTRWSVALDSTVTIAENFNLAVERVSPDHVVLSREDTTVMTLHRC